MSGLQSEHIEYDKYQSDQQEVEWILQRGTRTQRTLPLSPSLCKTTTETTTISPTLPLRSDNPRRNRTSYHRPQSLPIQLSRHPTQIRWPLPFLRVPIPFAFLGIWFLVWLDDCGFRVGRCGDIETDFFVWMDGCSGCLWGHVVSVSIT